MRKICLLALLFISSVLQAKTYNAETLPIDLNAITYSRVINPDGILPQSSVSLIDSLLLELQLNKGVQAMVIAVTNIENDDPYQFCIDLGNKYGVGSKDSKGFILSLATDDRSYWILTGSGLEEFLPDAICKRIENRAMIPLLKESKWDQALFQTVFTIKEYLEGNEELVASYNSDDEELTGFELLLIFLWTVGPSVLISFLAYYNERKKSYCKNCKQHKMKLVKRVNTRIGKSNRMKSVETWKCSHCFNVETRTYERSTGEFYEGTFVGGGFGHIPGGSSSGSSSGSFGGFGGGHFSGGGAGGHF